MFISSVKTKIRYFKIRFRTKTLRSLKVFNNCVGGENPNSLLLGKEIVYVYGISIFIFYFLTPHRFSLFKIFKNQVVS